MTLDQYYNDIVNLTLSFRLKVLNYTLDELLNRIKDAMQARGLKDFVYYFSQPPSDVINRYMTPSEFTNEWINADRPVIVIVNNENIDVVTNAESILSYDMDYKYTFDLIYPFYNISEEERSVDVFYPFVDTFMEMFEYSGRKWIASMPSGDRVFLDRTAMTLERNELLLFADILCHVATCSVTFKMFVASEKHELDFGNVQS